MNTNNKRRERRAEGEQNVQQFYIYKLLLLGCFLGRLRDLSTRLIGLVYGLDDTDSNSLPHVTDGKTTKWRVFVIRFDTHRLRRNKLGNASVTRLDEFRGGFN